ncbi:hypothetical protein BC629DRAFT_1528943 [Irpex lacteus]|nr:hypothetical protein BC629DRAFT_1528943 [Irpex lacteus]
MEFNMHNNRPNDTWEQANQTTLPPIGALIDATSVNDASNNVFTYRSGSPGPLGDYPVISGHFSNRPGSPLYSQAHIASPAPPSPSTRVPSLYPPNVPFIPAPDNAQPLANQADVQVDGFAVAQFGQGRSVQQVQPAVSFTPAARSGQQGAIVPQQQRPRPRPRQSLTLPQDPFDYRSRAPSRSVVEPYQPQFAPTPPAHHVAQAAAPPVAPAVSQTTRTTSTSGARAHSIIPSIPDDSDVEDLGSTIPIPPTRSPSPTLLYKSYHSGRSRVTHPLSPLLYASCHAS